MLNTLLIVLLAGICCAVISCQSEKSSVTSNVLQQLDGVEQSMFAATSNGDSTAFRKVCGADYFTINANGETATLEEAIRSVPRFKGATNELSEQRQRVFGNFVVRTGRLKVFIGAQQVAEALYTTGWLYRDGRWQFVHWQGTLAGMMLEPLAGKVMLEPAKIN
ncbi:nuclear transport factor 2 family protein [Chryseolinea sp. T2]|uniref:nuclear transport factor 2 family protein n=1 Tax=Chryseolinea sp. T2 TaxID=3129255 RepID=UPI003078775C